MSSEDYFHLLNTEFHTLTLVALSFWQWIAEPWPEKEPAYAIGRCPAGPIGLASWITYEIDAHVL